MNIPPYDYFYPPPRPKYGVGQAIFDFFLVIITGGLWFLWILIRYLRSNTR